MAKPLAERLRPKTLDEYIGQKHLVGKNAVLRNMIESGRIVSFILWGAARRRQDHACAYYSQSVESSVLYVECCVKRSERGTRGYR